MVENRVIASPRVGLKSKEMTWNELFGSALKRLYAHETTAIPILEQMGEKAWGEEPRAILQEMIDAAPARIGRLEIACEFAEVALEKGRSHSVEGWSLEVEDLVLREPTGPVTDATILTLVLKLTRMRAAAYEVAYVLSRRIGNEPTTNLVHALWMEDQASNLHTSHILLNLVTEETVDWDAVFRLP